MTMMISLFCKIFLASSLSHAAALQTQTLAYTDKGAALEAFLAAQEGKQRRPAVLIVHDWMGLGDFYKKKAEQLAGEGLVAMAVDVYGKGVRPKDSKEASALAGKYKGDRALMRSRMRAAYDELVKRPDVDPKKIFVMGYCFGGTAALELARSGAPLAATVSFHGGLSTPTPEDARNIKGAVLVLHGADDPAVPPAEVKAFQTEMDKPKVKYSIIQYPGAVHAFTNPGAGNDNSKGAAYNAEADRKSWADFHSFLREQKLL